MPFYLRKSVRAGPFRFNFSKSGIGISAGVTGFRIGTGPRGHYIHAGRGGLYYRTTIPIGKPKASRVKPGPTSHVRKPQPTSSDPDIEMIPVSSASVLEMEEAEFSELLTELNDKQGSISMAKALGWVGAAITIVAVLSAGAAGLVVGLICSLAAYIFGAWLDSYRRCVVLMYDLEDDAANAYERMTAAFDELAACKGKWHIDAGGAVTNIHSWKRNAGASHVLDKYPTKFEYSLPSVVKANVTPPAIQSGKEMLYFLPDLLLIIHGNKVGAVAYENLVMRAQLSNFIEDGTVPPDTRVLYHTWKHPNKGGGPDRRFADNYQIPVCEYESIHLTSPNGLNELLQVSRAGLAQPLADAITSLSLANGSKSTRLALPKVY